MKELASDKGKKHDCGMWIKYILINQKLDLCEDNFNLKGVFLTIIPAGIRKANTLMSIK
jgi:hypothetical protein